MSGELYLYEKEARCFKIKVKQQEIHTEKKGRENLVFDERRISKHNFLKWKKLLERKRKPVTLFIIHIFL